MVPLQSCLWKDLVLKQRVEDRVIRVATVDTSHGDGELEVFELMGANVYCVLEVVCEQEERGCVFEAALAEECIGVLERGGLPARVGEVVLQKSGSAGLFSVPSCHAPQAEEDGFLLKG